jgi:hypothetical protein
MFPTSSLFLLTSILALVASLLAWRAHVRRTLPLPPGPPPAPIIGNVHQVPKQRPWLQYHKWGQEYGPVVHLDMLGQPIILLSTVKAAYELLSKRGATYSDRPRLVMAGELATKNKHILLRPYDEGYKC